MKSIDDKISKLSPKALRELEDFIDKLLRQIDTSTQKKLSQDWAGGLKDFKSQYSALDLQKKASEWRNQ